MRVFSPHAFKKLRSAPQKTPEQVSVRTRQTPHKHVPACSGFCSKPHPLRRTNRRLAAKKQSQTKYLINMSSYGIIIKASGKKHPRRV